MKFFLSGLGNWYVDLSLIQKAVLEADELGFDGVVIPDHYMWGETEWLKRPDRNRTLESWITLTYLAAKTRNIRLGTLVTPIPFRSPSMLAKMVSTIDILSNGRTIVGVGAGWSQVEFEGFSEWNEPKVRVNKTKEGVELMIKLWTQKKVTFKGRYYQATGAVVDPKPLQKPYPPLLFGGVGDRMLRLAGAYADICYIPPFFPEEKTEYYREGKMKVLKAAEQVNRKDKIAFMDGNLGSWKPYDSRDYIKEIKTAEERGAEYFLTSFTRSEEIIGSMRRFAKEVLPSFK
ncbi:MAG: LLM class flavin-dependent oxidoreductase [Candidatus Bathyarchaeota archaeon]|jgi:alkanesulfonate monooxygenase SsuD/methylene tetrahydromethanopterin reductase-like flavin-dependent oxidoreductase (luciferase family)